MECSHMPAPSRQEFLLEKILEQLVILNNRLEPSQDSNAIREQNLMHQEDVNVPEDRKIDIYKHLQNDNLISNNTKVTYRKHMDVLNRMIQNKSLNDIDKKDIQDQLLSNICKKYTNLNSRISYLSTLKYMIKASESKDLSGINDCFQAARTELTEQKSMTNKSELSPIFKAQQIWKQLIDTKTDLPFLKMLIEIYKKLGVIRSSELIKMRFYNNASQESKLCLNYIDYYSKTIVIKDHKNFNKNKEIKTIDLNDFNLDLFKEHCRDDSLVFPQINKPFCPYSDTTGFNKVLKSYTNLDYTTLRQVKVSLVFAYGNEEEKLKLSKIHGTALDTMMKEYQSYVKLK